MRRAVVLYLSTIVSFTLQDRPITPAVFPTSAAYYQLENDERVRTENTLGPSRPRQILLDRHGCSTSPTGLKYPNLFDRDRGFELPPGSEPPRAMVGKPTS